jgi:hypothetical protein
MLHGVIEFELMGVLVESIAWIRVKKFKKIQIWF